MGRPGAETTGDKFAWSEFEQPQAGPEGARAGSPSYLTRFHGVFALNSRHRALVTPGKRGKGDKTALTKESPTPAERHAAMRWAQRLKRVFHIDVEVCAACGGPVTVIAAIEDPAVIKTILDHLDKQGKPQATSILPEPRTPRAPPVDQRVTSLR